MSKVASRKFAKYPKLAFSKLVDMPNVALLNWAKSPKVASENFVPAPKVMFPNSFQKPKVALEKSRGGELVILFGSSPEVEFIRENGAVKFRCFIVHLGRVDDGKYRSRKFTQSFFGPFILGSQRQVELAPS